MPDEPTTFLRFPSALPYQLHHTFATRVEREFGIESSKACLGHASAEIARRAPVERQDLERIHHSRRSRDRLTLPTG